MGSVASGEAMKANYQPVLVEWNDARGSGSWFTMADFKPWCEDWRSRRIVSCGLLARYDAEIVVLVKSKDMHEKDMKMVAHPLEIPRPMVRSVQELVVKGRPKRNRHLKRKR